MHQTLRMNGRQIGGDDFVGDNVGKPTRNDGANSFFLFGDGPTCHPKGNEFSERFYLDLLFDEYPSETSWTLTKLGTGEVVSSSAMATILGHQQYGSFYANSTLVVDQCVSGPAKYRFTIRDSGGNGFYSKFSYYRISLGNTGLKFRRGNFGAAESTPSSEHYRHQ